MVDELNQWTNQENGLPLNGKHVILWEEWPDEYVLAYNVLTLS